MDFEHYKYVVVEGPLGVGKTTLARKIAQHFHTLTLLEQPEENPFLDRFYRDAARYALPAQMFFLFQRMNQLRDLGLIDLTSTQVVSDFLLDKDTLFARLTLADDEFSLYQQVYHALQPQAPKPDLVIYLQAAPETLIERVQKRGVAMEHGISELYLSRLSESYSRFFYDYEAAPLLIVNADHLNPIESDDDFALLLTHLKNMRGRREFFNRGE